LIRSYQGDHDENLRLRLAKLHQVKHVFLFGNAREAFYALLCAYDRPGGVLMPAYNSLTVPEAAIYAGYHPVFVDIDMSSLNMSIETLKRSLSPEISVILALHQYGIPCDVEEIMHLAQQHGILVLEDAAPSFGAELRGRFVGAIGDAGFVSFGSSKVIAGEKGGALLTNDDDLAQKVDCFIQKAASPVANLSLFVKAAARKLVLSSWCFPLTKFCLRVLGEEKMFQVVPPHTTMPSHFLKECPSFTNALVLGQLDQLDWNLSRRRQIGQIYEERLSEQPWLKTLSIPEDCSPAWIQFPVLIDDKERFYKYMQHNGIDLSWTFRYSCADSYHLDGFPNSQKAAKTVLGLPTYPLLTDEQAQYICDVILKYPFGGN
jgi:dTDP-4-amino-4,6-dideoxygalactose transaminase